MKSLSVHAGFIVEASYILGVDEMNKRTGQVADKSNRKVYVRYLDHTLFKNVNSTLIKPCIRETMGWVEREDDQALLILWDRSCSKLPHERALDHESGLVILKSTIIELGEIE